MLIGSRTSERCRIATEVGGPEAGECWCAASKYCPETSHALANEHQEFERLQEGETIYKLAGPVLLKQDKFEAENTVKGRLDFISSEM